MAEIDEIKEEIGAIKTYLGFIVAFIITISAGISKLYLDDASLLLIILGAISIFTFSVLFAFLAKRMHHKIKSLKEL